MSIVEIDWVLNLNEIRQSGMILALYAAMAELVDALDSGSSRGNSVDVRVILAAFTTQEEV